MSDASVRMRLSGHLLAAHADKVPIWSGGFMGLYVSFV